MEKSKTIEIPEYRYKDLLHAEMMLSCLESAGVDNWEGYEYAMEQYDDMMNKEDKNDKEDSKDDGQLTLF